VPDGVAARTRWIDDACRRFSDSVGWPIVFRRHDDPATTGVTESDHVGGLYVDLDPGYENRPEWEQVRRLTHLLSELINRALALESGDTPEARFARRMHHLAREIASPVAIDEAIPRLLQLAVVSCPPSS
jgi:hypothetical protein